MGDNLRLKLRELHERYAVCEEMMQSVEKAEEKVAYRQGLEQILDEIYEVERQLVKEESDGQD